MDESRAWLKRIAITWVVLNSLGFVLAYITPFFRTLYGIKLHLSEAETIAVTHFERGNELISTNNVTVEFKAYRISLKRKKNIPLRNAFFENAVKLSTSSVRDRI